MKRSSNEDTRRSSTNPALDAALARRGSQIKKKDKKKRKKQLKDFESIFHKHLLTKKGQRNALLKSKSGSQTNLTYTEKTAIAQQFAYPTKSLDFILDEEFQNAHLAKFERQNKGKEKETEKPAKAKEKDKSEFDSILDRHKQIVKQEEKTLHQVASSLFSNSSIAGSKQASGSKKNNLLVIVALAFLYTVALLGVDRGLYMVLACDEQVCQCDSNNKNAAGRNAGLDSFTNTSLSGRYNPPKSVPQIPPKIQSTQKIQNPRKPASSRAKDDDNKLLFVLQHFNHWNVPGDLPPLPHSRGRTKEAYQKHRKFWMDIYDEFLTKYMGLSQITVQISLKNYQTDFWISEKLVFVYGSYKQNVAFVKYIGLLEDGIPFRNFFFNACTCNIFTNRFNVTYPDIIGYTARAFIPKEYYEYARKTVEGVWKLPCGFPEFFGNCRKGKKWVDYDFQECYFGLVWGCKETGEFSYMLESGGRTWHHMFVPTPEHGLEIWREEL